jgi:hypothetical protein
MLDELMTHIKNEIKYGIDLGMKIDINDFFKGCDDVKDYFIEVIEENTYMITTKLKNYKLQEVKKVFSQFLRCMEYSAGSFYTRQNIGETIEYDLYSIKEDMTGFHCKIKFTN